MTCRELFPRGPIILCLWHGFASAACVMAPHRAQDERYTPSCQLARYHHRLCRNNRIAKGDRNVTGRNATFMKKWNSAHCRPGPTSEMNITVFSLVTNIPAEDYVWKSLHCHVGHQRELCTHSPTLRTSHWSLLCTSSTNSHQSQTGGQTLRTCHYWYYPNIIILIGRF